MISPLRVREREKYTILSSNYSSNSLFFPYVLLYFSSTANTILKLIKICFEKIFVLIFNIIIYSDIFTFKLRKIELHYWSILIGKSINKINIFKLQVIWINEEKHLFILITSIPAPLPISPYSTIFNPSRPISTNNINNNTIPEFLFLLSSKGFNLVYRCCTFFSLASSYILINYFFNFCYFRF